MLMYSSGGDSHHLRKAKFEEVIFSIWKVQGIFPCVYMEQLQYLSTIALGFYRFFFLVCFIMFYF